VKAVRIDASGGVAVVEMPVPAIGPGEALVRPRVSGICGSDLLDWYARRKAGTVLGHELAAEVLAVGEGVTGFAPGDRVVPHHHAPCFACRECEAGQYVHCAGWRSSHLDPGGMAEAVRIPAENLSRDTQKIPVGVSDDQACFTEPLATVLKAFRRGRFAAGRSFFCVGLGTSGQLAIRVARASGAIGIGAADRVRSRLALAEASGAEGVVDVASEPLALGARRLSQGRGFDFVFVCPGKSEVIREALQAVAPGGTLLVFTMAPPGEVWPVDLYELYFREISVVPSYSCGPDDTRDALSAIASRRIAVADLVSHRFGIAQAVEAFARAREAEGSMKVVIAF
jgi:L-iditol 2-dehydrogenase